MPTNQTHTAEQIVIRRARDAQRYVKGPKAQFNKQTSFCFKAGSERASNIAAKQARA